MFPGEDKMKTKRLIFTVDLPLKKVWSILRNVEHHLPLLPGYIRHEMVAENEFLLLIKRKNAWINKWWNLRITVKEWQEPSTLSLSVEEMNKIFSGEALVQTTKAAAQKTLVKIYFKYDISGSLNKFFAHMIQTKDDEDIIQEIKSFLNGIP